VSSNGPVVVTPRERAYLVTLAYGANAIDDVFLAALEGALDRLEAAGSPALVVTSAHATIFCPGLDLKKLDGRPREDVRAIVFRYNALLRRVATYPGPVIGAVAGHAIGGGCLLAMACDRRVMARARARLGLSEINLGIPVPAGAVAMMLALFPTRAVEQLVLEGDGLGGERALELGLVERLADAEHVVEDACRLASHLATRPPDAFAAAKRFLRHGLGDAMAARDEEGMDEFLDRWFDPDTQDRIGVLVAQMRR
jgi:enoyl-CoA hydratase/carnithine racemase